MAKQRVLISGAGVAGPTAGYWLTQAGFEVTIVERSPNLRSSGQNIDIRGHGLTVIERMGLEPKVRSVKTNEKGLRFVDAQNNCRAEFPVADGTGFTGEIEIMRGELAIILYEATKDQVLYIFGQWGAYFAVPSQPTDSGWARWYNAPSRRMALVRPDHNNVTRASLWIMGSGQKLQDAHGSDVYRQKALVQEVFADAGWETERLLRGMQEADDFYLQHIAQIKMDRWSRGRVVLVGDGAFCPTPISGMGTTVAIVGAYVLAGELISHSDDHLRAFDEYESKMRPFVAKAQKLTPGTPSVANPQTALGIKIMHLVLGMIAWTRLDRLVGGIGLFSPPATAMDLPVYDLTGLRHCPESSN
ncbi:hypothetical protein PV10_01956 [Exophiala mesophila]|uniref:FAD-binding domain-containing protein n=1 Tax=Exophiala mesophila TaxID=212818 RepID=A0A0D1WXM1_EXOME|nr:uncharacterized protein PV10_01956 [Exophiala mesophila]KIV94165.1 hypothetical protein PV10_01956 [Exophiala mesophila]